MTSPAGTVLIVFAVFVTGAVLGAVTAALEITKRDSVYIDLLVRQNNDLRRKVNDLIEQAKPGRQPQKDQRQ